MQLPGFREPVHPVGPDGTQLPEPRRAPRLVPAYPDDQGLCLQRADHAQHLFGAYEVMRGRVTNAVRAGDVVMAAEVIDAACGEAPVSEFVSVLAPVPAPVPVSAHVTAFLSVGADCGRSLRVEAAPEHRQPSEHHSFQRIEQPMAPVDRGPQLAVPARPGSAAIGQQRQLVVQAVQDAGQRE